MQYYNVVKRSNVDWVGATLISQLGALILHADDLQLLDKRPACESTASNTGMPAQIRTSAAYALRLF